MRRHSSQRSDPGSLAEAPEPNPLYLERLQYRKSVLYLQVKSAT